MHFDNTSKIMIRKNAQKKNSICNSFTGAIARNLSCPAVSHNCILHVDESGNTIRFVKKKAPIVLCCFGEKYP